MAVVRDYTKLAKDIKEAVGADSIISATHCATRLRLVLKESPSAAVTSQISGMAGVIQVVENGGQYQIVIGTHAKDVYNELAKIVDLSGEMPEVKQSLLNRIIATMSAVFAPFVYILAAAGLIQGCLIVITQFAPDFASTGVYGIFNFISWTPFTFLPAFIAISASRHFKCNIYVALACCLALVSTSWADMAARIADGETIKFLFFKLSETTYASTVLPPLFLVLILSYLERFLEKKLPDGIKALATPFLCMAIMVPFTILVIGPVSEIVANAIASGYNSMYNVAPAAAALIIGGVWQIIVVFGVHWGMVPIILADFAANGYDSIQVFVTCAIVAQVGATFAVFFKSRNKEFKPVALSAGLTGIFGITEPAIYGVTLRLKKPLICGCISSAVGSFVTTLFNTQYYVYAGLPGPLTIFNAISENTPSSFIGMLLGAAVAFAGSFIMVMIIGFDDPISQTITASAGEAEVTEAEKITADNGEKIVYAPASGRIVKLNDVPDEAFASGAMGMGVAVEPSEGRIFSPVDGEISAFFPTGHAVGLMADTGIEILIHVGMDTVQMDGDGFLPKAKEGDRVKKGDLLLEFDIEKIKAAGHPIITPVIITNTDDYSEVLSTEDVSVKPGDKLIECM